MGVMVKIKKISEKKYNGSVYDLSIDNIPSYSVNGVFVHNSGSSSLLPISDILLERNNKILIIGVLPFKKEILPPLANAVQSINSLIPIISEVSVILFDNNKLIKKYENNWSKVNEHIIKRVDYIINLLEKYNSNDYSPITLDESELESVVFGGGFIDVSETFLEERLPKFDYGRLDKTTKNCMVCMFVDTKIKDKEELDDYHKILTGIVSRIAGRISNARMIPGILRASINYTNAEDKSIKNRTYVTIASGLNIEKYLKKIEKMRDDAMKRAEVFSEKMRGNRLIKGSKSKRLLDI